ncbi:MAG: ATP synthase subunit I [Lachnospiraceae bacterium]|nr:ATP synthase subunit I [Lachnospiraceae bacterium]
MKTMKRKLWEMNSALRDLYVGLTIYFVLASLVGVFVVEDKAGFLTGLLFGVLVSFGLVYHMYRTLDRGLDMETKDAEKYILSQSSFRLFMMLVAAYIGLFVEFLSFPGVVLGLFGIKVSALMQPLVSINITNKIFREGG